MSKRLIIILMSHFHKRLDVVLLEFRKIVLSPERESVYIPYY
jgi:hypothetical protein